MHHDGNSLHVCLLIFHNNAFSCIASTLLNVVVLLSGESMRPQTTTPTPTGADEQNAACTTETQVDTKDHLSAIMIVPFSSAATDLSRGNAILEQDLNPKSDSQMPALQSGTAAEEEDHMQVSMSKKPVEEQNQLQVSASEGLAEEEHMQVKSSEGPTPEEDQMQVSTSEEPVQPGGVPRVNEEEQRRRANTPEELANLGKAVDMVQARSCQLSPSLLTVGQTPPDMDSPARHAFERGRHDCQSQACR